MKPCCPRDRRALAHARETGPSFGPHYAPGGGAHTLSTGMRECVGRTRSDQRSEVCGVGVMGVGEGEGSSSRTECCVVRVL